MIYGDGEWGVRCGEWAVPVGFYNRSKSRCLKQYFQHHIKTGQSIRLAPKDIECSPRTFP